LPAAWGSNSAQATRYPVPVDETEWGGMFDYALDGITLQGVVQHRAADTGVIGD
jgi:hypothetical protein